MSVSSSATVHQNSMACFATSSSSSLIALCVKLKMSCKQSLTYPCSPHDTNLSADIKQADSQQSVANHIQSRFLFSLKMHLRGVLKTCLHIGWELGIVVGCDFDQALKRCFSDFGVWCDCPLTNHLHDVVPLSIIVKVCLCKFKGIIEGDGRSQAHLEYLPSSFFHPLHMQPLQIHQCLYMCIACAIPDKVDMCQ